MPQNLETIVQRMINAGESEENIASVIKASKATAAPQSDSGGLATVASGEAVPLSANLAARVATSPTLPRTLSTTGRILGAVSAPVTGAIEGGPVGAMAGIVASPKASWLGGKTGWFGGKMIQSAAAPIASGLEAIAPYAQGLSTLGAAQGVGDLAQMAEPNRKDIGVLGIGPSVDVPGAHPPLINDLIARLRARLGR